MTLRVIVESIAQVCCMNNGECVERRVNMHRSLRIALAVTSVAAVGGSISAGTAGAAMSVTPGYVIGNGGTGVSTNITTSCGIVTLYGLQTKAGLNGIVIYGQGVTGSKYVQHVAFSFTVTAKPSTQSVSTGVSNAGTTHNLTTTKNDYVFTRSNTHVHVHTIRYDIRDKTGCSSSGQMTSFTAKL